MKRMTASPQTAGWLTAMIERARTDGVDNQDIAAALESTIDLRSLTLTRTSRNRLVATIADNEVTVNDLLIDEN